MHQRSIDRRQFLAGVVASGISRRFDLSPQFREAGAEERPIAEVFLDLNHIHKWDMSNGDTWDPFWADDDNLYAFNCDGRGFGPKPMNLAFNRLSGKAVDGLTGVQVNAMDEYGKGSQKGPDNATWKACGQECIDGVFCAFVSRNVYGSDSKDRLLRQTAMNSSLIRSSDRGRTWTRSAQESYDHPMWPGPHFGAPFFVHYGQNGGQVERDGAREYVYAASTNGFWNDGDQLILGRVRRADLATLDSSQWEYYAAGLKGATWSRDIRSAAAILARPAKCGQTPICYVSELGIYLLISWYNSSLLTRWFEPTEMNYDFYQAPHPWGPWSIVASTNDRFLGPGYHMYGPSLCARFQRRVGADVEVSLFTSGCPFDDVAAGPYKLWHIPLLLRTAALPRSQMITASDPLIHYHGAWFPWTTVERAASKDLPRATQAKGSSAELTFSGTGIEYIAEKSNGLGNLDIYLDGELQSTSSLDLSDFPVLFGVVIFSKLGLPKKTHTIRVVSAGETRVNVEAFKIFE